MDMANFIRPIKNILVIFVKICMRVKDNLWKMAKFMQAHLNKVLNMGLEAYRAQTAWVDIGSMISSYPKSKIQCFKSKKIEKVAGKNHNHKIKSVEIVNFLYSDFSISDCSKNMHKLEKSMLHFGLNEWIHLVKITSCPHHPHWNTCHYKSNQANPVCINVRTFDFPTICQVVIEKQHT